jgi:hypothetical protein
MTTIPISMSSRQPILLASLLCPGLQSQGQILPQQYDYSFQLYKEDDDRMRIESHYIRGQIEINDATSFRFQALSDAISGASPTGILPGNNQPYIAEVDPDIRYGILGALSRQFGDHRVELEISHSEESDYVSSGIALSDVLELNQKNTTVSYGINYLDDLVRVAGVGDFDKNAYDLFAGVSQILDKNTVLTLNLTLGYSDGYLNDPYKFVQRNEIDNSIPGFPIPVVNIYRENRPDERFRKVLQFEGRHYFESADAALDGVFRLSNDDFGVFSQTVQLEWRQAAGERFQVIPFFRYYHQSAADFFVNTLNNLNISDPANPTSSDPNWSADYRLSSFNAISGGLRLRYQFNDIFSANACYERYVMSPTGSSSDNSPDQSYPSADIWTVGISAKF